MEPEAIWQDGREMGENVKSFAGANPDGGPVEITGREQEKCRESIDVSCRLVQNEGFMAALTAVWPQAAQLEGAVAALHARTAGRGHRGGRV